MEDLQGHLTEFAHGTQQAAEAQTGSSSKQLYTGYIATWDKDKNQVTVINPTNRNPQTGNCVESQPMQLFSLQTTAAGGDNPINDQIDQWGMVIAPFAGCQKNGDPTGEQVVVLDLNPGSGFGIALMGLFNDQALPPSQVPISNKDLQGGEALWVLPSGTTIHLDNDGDLNIYTQKPQSQSNNTQGTGDLIVGTDGGMSINTNQNPGDMPPEPDAGDIDVNAARDINEVAQRDITENAQRDITETAVRNITEDAQNDIQMTAGHDIRAAATRDVDIQSTVDTLLTVGADLSAIVTNDALIAAGGGLTETVGADSTETIVGNKTVTAGAAVTITATGQIEIGSAALIEILAPLVNIGALAEILQPLITESLIPLFNAHTHHGVTTGTGVTGIPVVPLVTGAPLTTTSLAAG